jgi:mannose-6-phosphate isomerase-like protein (cupin superfamily)
VNPEPDYNAEPRVLGEVDDANPWGTNLNVKCEPLEAFDLDSLASDVTVPWHNQTLARVNDCVVRMGVVEGIYPWHRHEHEDEFFLVIRGELRLDVEGGRTVPLHPGQGVVVPAGHQHRPRAYERTIMLMIEGAGIVPTGD